MDTMTTTPRRNRMGPKPPRPAVPPRGPVAATPTFISGPGSKGLRSGSFVVNGGGFGSGADGGGGGAPGGGGPPTFDNTAQTQPDMSWAIEEMKKRYGGDMGAGRAIDIAGGKIREAALGVDRARTISAAQRGTSGTGADYNLRKRDASEVLNDISGAATSITQDRENQRDAMLQRILGGGQAIGSLAQGDRGLALQSWQAYEANQRAKESAILARQMALLGLLSNGGL